MKETDQMQSLEGSGAERSVGTQTGSMTGQIPRLSKVNLFTLLSLWMELFPGVEAQGQKSQKTEEESRGPLGDNEELTRVSTEKKTGEENWSCGGEKHEDHWSSLLQ